MPYTEYSSRDRSQRVLREMGRGKGCGKAGVLHADFDGDRAAFGNIQLQHLSDEIAKGVAQQVVEHYHCNDQQAGSQELRGVGGYYGCDNGYDGYGGDQRKDLHDFFCRFLKEMVDDKAGQDRHDHDFHDGKEHTHHIDIDTGAGVYVSQQRGQERRQDGGYRGHSYRQRHVAFGKVRHYIGRSTARAGSHQDNADGQLRRQAERLGQQEGKQRHHRELRDTADHHVLGTAEDNFEIMGFQRQAHAEHHDPEKGIDIRRLEERHGVRGKQRQGSYRDDDDRHVFADESGYVS